MQSESFIFNGIKSIDMEGMYAIRTETGLVESPFFGGQEINEEWLIDRITPYDYGTTLSPIEFTIQISPIEKEWTPKLRGMVGQWLIHSDYKPFQMGEDLDKIYYAKCIGAPNFELINNRGYLELTFRTNSAYAWTPEYIKEFKLQNNHSKQIIEFNNLSNINKRYRPIIEIELADMETNIILKNLTTGEKEFEFKGLVANEIVSIDNENEYMVSNRATSNPFSKFNGHWLELVYGINKIEVTGKCIIKTKMQFPIIR